MSFILHCGGYYYLAEKVEREGNLRHKIIRPANPDEIKTFLEQKKRESTMTLMICDYPLCDATIKTSREQKFKLNTIDPLKGRLEFIYCSKKCQQEHLKQLGKGK